MKLAVAKDCAGKQAYGLLGLQSIDQPHISERDKCHKDYSSPSQYKMASKVEWEQQVWAVPRNFSGLDLRIFEGHSELDQECLACLSLCLCTVCKRMSRLAANSSEAAMCAASECRLPVIAVTFIETWILTRMVWRIVVTMILCTHMPYQGSM